MSLIDKIYNFSMGVNCPSAARRESVAFAVVVRKAPQERSFCEENISSIEA
jgi:hypothetical protein